MRYCRNRHLATILEEIKMDAEAHFRELRTKLLTRGIMVDTETAGEAPSRFPLMSLGANLISDPQQKFYITLKPDRFEFREEALRITGFTLEDLAISGTDPKEAIAKFNQWALSFGIKDPLFVARNACFDWMFYCDYASRYHEENPFGYFAFDTKSAFGSLVKNSPVPHHAGQDAYIQTLDLHRFFKTL
jgi:DNA polymerase III alpha subunit (gram-positive type)